MRTRNQNYAVLIFKQVDSEVKTKEDAYKKQYGSMAHKLPVLIRTAGLAQALAFVSSRNKDADNDLLTHLAKSILGENSDKKSLLDRSRTAELGEYMRLTEKALEALVWYKRFAQSILNVYASNDFNEEVGGRA